MSPAPANKLEFPILRDPSHPVHLIADALEPYLRVIVERFGPEKIILFGSQAYGEPDEHSDVDLLIVRRGITSENQSNLEIRQSFWTISTPRPAFTILTKTPEQIKMGLAEHSPFYEEIVTKGVEVYVA